MIYTVLLGILWYSMGSFIGAFFTLLGLETLRQFLLLIKAWADTAFPQK